MKYHKMIHALWSVDPYESSHPRHTIYVSENVRHESAIVSTPTPGRIAIALTFRWREIQFTGWESEYRRPMAYDSFLHVMDNGAVIVNAEPRGAP